MNSSLSLLRPTLRIHTDKEVFPPLLDKLRQELEGKVHVLQNSATEDWQGVLFEEVSDRGGVWSYTVQCQELTFHLQQLHSHTEQELSNINTQLCEIAERQQQVSSELSDLQEKKRHTDQELKGSHNLHTSTLLLHTRRELQAHITDRFTQSEQLVFQEEALSALHDLLTQDLHQYQEETQKLHSFTLRILRDYYRSESEQEQISTVSHSDHSMQGRNDNQPGISMQNGSVVSDPAEVSSSFSSSSSSFSALPPYQTTATNGVDSDQSRRTNHGKSPTSEGASATADGTSPTASLTRRSNLTRSGSVKDLIHKFSGTDYVPTPGSPHGSSPVALSSIGPSGFSQFPETGHVITMSSSDVSAVQMKTLKQGEPSKTQSMSATESPVPSISVIPPCRGTGPVENGQSTTESPVRDSSEESTLVKKLPEEDGSAQVQFGSEPSRTQDGSPKTLKNNSDSGRESVADSGLGSESDMDPVKHPDSPASEEEAPPTPRVLPSHNHNPKYQLFLNNDHSNGPGGLSNGSGGGGRDPDGTAGGVENGPRLPRWESSRLGPNHYRGSLESLASRDWDNMSDRQGGVDSPPRVFISPYTTAASMEYNPMYRMSEFKVQGGGLSPATSELNLFSYSSRSASPVPTPTISAPRTRFSTYDTLARRRADATNTVIPNHAVNLRSATLGAHNKRDYIEELTKQLDSCQKRNQFLEAESVEMDKERNQIRFEMRGLLVNNEDLLRNNAQLTNEMKRMRERVMEMERENQAMTETYRGMEIELKEARDMMVEANTQEYAFNVLQQTLKNRIKDAEENLETQTQHAQSQAEKLWLAERQLEVLELDKETRDKKTIELSDTIFRLETELGEALQASSQAGAELSLQQKLRDDAQNRVEELEESLMEKDQELQRLQGVVTKLQGEVSEKLSDKERTLEEEIQLRERIQLQWKQAERTVDDLHMEIQTVNLAKDDLSKQLKQAQEKMIDLESDLEELHDSEQRWASKHKRSIEQTEQLQLKLIQEKDLNEQLDCEKAILERQVRELRVEVDELQTSRVQEDVISRTESRVKELENVLRTEERNKAVLNNTISKLERKINELTDQLEEEHRISTEQKDLMTQRIRALKRQLNEAEEETSRKEAQYRHTQRELSEERETSGRLQRQLLDQHLQMKRKESAMMRQTLDSLRLDLSVDEEDDVLRQNANTKV